MEFLGSTQQQLNQYIDNHHLWYRHTVEALTARHSGIADLQDRALQNRLTAYESSVCEAAIEHHKLARHIHEFALPESDMQGREGKLREALESLWRFLSLVLRENIQEYLEKIYKSPIVMTYSKT